MTGLDSYAAQDEATLLFTEPLAGVDWCWIKTTNRVATYLEPAPRYQPAKPRSKRITRGLDLLFSQYDELLKRLAD